MGVLSNLCPREVSCERKMRHNTRDEAREALAAMVRHGRAADGFLNVYRCGHCGCFHIGNLDRVAFALRRDVGPPAAR